MRNVGHAKCSCVFECDDNCSQIPVYLIRDTINDLKSAIANYFNSKIVKLTFGYGGCTSVENVNILVSYKDILEGVHRTIINGYRPCICDSHILDIIENAKEHLVLESCSKKKLDYKLDNKSLNLKGSCTSYELWEKAMFIRMPELKATVDYKQCVKLSFDVKVKLHETTCDFLKTVDVLQKKCDLDLDIKIDTKECQVNFDYLVKTYNCDVPFKAYVKLVEKGVTQEELETIYENGFSLDYTESDFFINTGDNQYAFKDLSNLSKIINTLK